MTSANLQACISEMNYPFLCIIVYFAGLKITAA